MIHTLSKLVIFISGIFRKTLEYCAILLQIFAKTTKIILTGFVKNKENKMLITSVHPSFTGVLVSNNSLSKAKAYAVRIGEKDNYNRFRNGCKNLPGDSIKITSSHNFKPVESVRTIVRVKENNKIIRQADIFQHEFSDIGEAAYHVLKSLNDPESRIYKQLFR